MKIGKIQERDACLALVFLILLIWFFQRQEWIVYAAMSVLLLGMIWPGAMRPFAIAWFGLAAFLGRFTSSILLTVVWLLLVVPVGCARRMFGRDSMGFKKWHGNGSTFVVRDHVYGPEDLKNPY